MKRYQQVAGVGALAVLIGAFLPWFTVRSGIFTVSVTGVETEDGKLTAGAGVLVLAVIFLAKQRAAIVTGVVVGVLVGALCAYDYWDAMENIGDEASLSPGFGLVLTFLGAVAMVAASQTVAQPGEPLPPPTLP